jgi:two-component system, chemotaxis family, protein-glutamate methylesterase/glutaminase
MKAPIRVLLADDSLTMLEALTALLNQCQDIQVVGKAMDGVEAVTMANKLRPDVITMDVLMPRLDGLAATAAIMAEAPSRVLIVCSVSETSQMDLSFRAIQAGALELIAKPRTSSIQDLRRWGDKVAESVRLMAEVPVITRIRRATLPLHLPDIRGAVDVFGIVASTGGPPALANILSDMPGDLPIPLLVAQHITEGFTQGLVRWLSSITPLHVMMAQEGDVVSPGYVYLAPDGQHLEVDSEGILRTPRGTGGHCPSGNRLLGSLASSYGARAGGAVLTGMGDDGAQGLLQIRNMGGQTLAQDAATSVVFGMPQAAHAAKATQTLVPLDAIGPMIRELCQRK